MFSKFSGSKKPSSRNPSANSSGVRESEPSESMARKTSIGPPRKSAHHFANLSRIIAETGSKTCKLMCPALPANCCQSSTTSPSWLTLAKPEQNSAKDSSPSPSLSKCRLQATPMFPSPRAFILPIKLFAWVMMTFREASFLIFTSFTRLPSNSSRSSWRLLPVVLMRASCASSSSRGVEEGCCSLSDPWSDWDWSPYKDCTTDNREERLEGEAFDARSSFSAASFFSLRICSATSRGLCFILRISSVFLIACCTRFVAASSSCKLSSLAFTWLSILSMSPASPFFEDPLRLPPPFECR
mmetsp:Transcript_12664/g.29740  ORF Transcript_12664/g.29740 Transcript_12664/m.29740 type:complete len:299 (-) Transcript_12664:4251-5147(-)